MCGGQYTCCAVDLGGALKCPGPPQNWVNRYSRSFLKVHNPSPLPSPLDKRTFFIVVIRKKTSPERSAFTRKSSKKNTRPPTIKKRKNSIFLSLASVFKLSFLLLIYSTEKLGTEIEKGIFEFSE